MIYFFSGTGNSEWAAKKIAEKTGDNAVRIVDVMRNGDEKIHIGANQRVGIVFPVYAWGLPKPVESFVKLLDIDKGAYCWAVCTCGSEAGCVMSVLKRHVPLCAAYSLCMPNNYIIGYDVDSDDRALEKVRAAAKRIESISEELSAGKGSFDVDKGKFAVIKTYVASRFFNKYAMDSEPFKTSTACTGCKLCEKNCPTGNITVVDGIPFWDNKCVQCFACINRCPNKAIEYGKLTAKKGRYFFNFSDEDIYSEKQ